MIIKLLRISLGLICIPIAIIGFIFPIMPGWPFFFLGIALISPIHGKKMFNWIKIKISLVWLWIQGRINDADDKAE